MECGLDDQLSDQQLLKDVQLSIQLMDLTESCR